LDAYKELPVWVKPTIWHWQQNVNVQNDFLDLNGCTGRWRLDGNKFIGPR
jgi:hypothetical protein